MYYMNHQYKLKELRLRYNFTQKDVANAIGITRQYYSKLESDQAAFIKASLEIILALCQLYQISINYFIDDYVEKKFHSNAYTLPHLDDKKL